MKVGLSEIGLMSPALFISAQLNYFPLSFRPSSSNPNGLWSSGRVFVQGAGREDRLYR